MDNKIITKRQKEVLKLIYGSVKNLGFPPSFSELKESLNISSNQSLLDIFTILERKNLIKRESTARGIKILKKGYEAINLPPLAPIVGFTSAGNFTEAIEEINGWIPLSKDVVGVSDNLIIVKIMGDSMVGAGIEDGDLILFQKAKDFLSGDIVLAQTPDGTTVKRFISEDKPPYVYLKPENSKYENIPFTDETRMTAKMIKKI